MRVFGICEIPEIFFRPFKRRIEMSCQSQSGQIGGDGIKKAIGSVTEDTKEVKKSNEGTERCFSTYLFGQKNAQYVSAKHRNSFTLVELLVVDVRSPLVVPVAQGLD